MTVEETLWAMLDGWTEDKWVKGSSSQGDRTCVFGREGCVTGKWDPVLRCLLDEVVAENWPQVMRQPPSVPAVAFNDHPDTTFADVVALIEKAAARAGEQGL